MVVRREADFKEAMPFGKARLEGAMKHIKKEFTRLRSISALLDAEAESCSMVRHCLNILPTKVEQEVMVPLTPLAFAPGRLVHTNEVMVDLRGGYWVLQTAASALQLIDRQEEQCAKSRVYVAEELRDLEGIRQTAEAEGRAFSAAATATAGDIPGATVTTDADGFLDIREPILDDDDLPDWVPYAADAKASSRQPAHVAIAPERATTPPASQKASGAAGDDGIADVLTRLRELERLEENADYGTDAAAGGNADGCRPTHACGDRRGATAAAAVSGSHGFGPGTTDDIADTSEDDLADLDKIFERYESWAQANDGASAIRGSRSLGASSGAGSGTAGGRGSDCGADATGRVLQSPADIYDYMLRADQGVLPATRRPATLTRSATAETTASRPRQLTGPPASAFSDVVERQWQPQQPGRGAARAWSGDCTSGAVCSGGPQSVPVGLPTALGTTGAGGGGAAQAQERPTQRVSKFKAQRRAGAGGSAQ
eukprot:NODE_6090_length_1707_cov_2.479747.p1 GENE.NODE_6090_length_1707_cov_2.479747~~NODE_6090_length_1707_cov_2.479747.p1  ORF type:complete len:500 (+),score=144.87 NODE_6090_length_1707_cov_2.479747:45-1502(+)